MTAQHAATRDGERRRSISKFGTALRHYRVSAGLSQEGLAERAGLSVRGISDLERGARTFPRLETVRMLADALELGERDRAILLAAARPELESTLPPDAPPPERPERGVTPRPLPIPPTKLVGRDEEIRHIVDIFRGGETRLITLTGQGGIGKSRLGLAIARGFSRELGGRVAYLELAPVRDPALVPGAIAAQLDVPIEPGTAPAQAIAQAIGQEPMLIVTDNWEHVIDAAPVLSVLLGHCEGLWILATSRERLRLRGEWELRLDPLPVPDDTHALDLIGESPAVRLFVQRANEAVDGFTLDESNAVTVLEICRKLDGIPLAIELAAARIRLFPPEQLLGRLEGRFQLLTEGPRDLPERLQTMHAAIAWSVDLLDEDERQLFARLAVFEGGFTIPTVVGVLSQIDPASDRIIVEERVVSLIEKSLVRPVDTDRAEPRFVMYETIRDFAAEQLGASDDRIDLTNAHAGHFIAVAEDAEAGLMSPDPMPTFELLENDIGNFRSAMAYLRDRGDAQEALRIASALAWFWTEPRFLAEGQQWLSSLLDASAARDMPGALRVRAIIAAGDLAIWQGELDEAAALHEEALELLRDLDDERQLAVVLRSLANVALERNEFSRADQLLKESRELARTTGNSWEVAASANLLGLSQTMQGAPNWAIERHREAVDIWRELGDSGRVFDALAGLGWAQLLAGTYAESAQSYLEALPLAIESDDILQIEWCIRAAAGLAAARGSEFERATRLFSASEAMREATGIALRVGIGEALAQLINTVHNQLGRERFTRGWAAGQRMSREQALDEARLVFEKAQAHRAVNPSD